jgi:hypothetical protein
MAYKIYEEQGQELMNTPRLHAFLLTKCPSGEKHPQRRARVFLDQKGQRKILKE